MELVMTPNQRNLPGVLEHLGEPSIDRFGPDLLSETSAMTIGTLTRTEPHEIGPRGHAMRAPKNSRRLSLKRICILTTGLAALAAMPLGRRSAMFGWAGSTTSAANRCSKAAARGAK